MAELTHIEWCDHTFNPWEGCTKVSPGCAHCYAEARNRRFGAGTPPNWGPCAPRRRTSELTWSLPKRWNKKAARSFANYAKYAAKYGHLEPHKRPHRPLVFCASLADWLDHEVYVDWRVDLLELIRKTPNLDWLLLTKRPGDFFAMLDVAQGCARDHSRLELAKFLCDWTYGSPPGNVWIGTTVEDQQRAEERIPELLKIPAKFRFLSVEPMLEAVDLNLMSHLGPVVRVNETYSKQDCLIHWVICGGESGPQARPFCVEWAWDLALQCRAAGVPFFMKQLGAKPRTTNANALDWPEHVRFHDLHWNPGAAAAAEVFIHDRKGGDLAEFPTELRIRQFPKVEE